MGLTFLAAVGLIFASGGCGRIADPNRKVIAEFSGEKMRRSDLKKIIREMSDEERPLIQSRDDLIDTLNRHINESIKAEVAKGLRLEKKITVHRDQARAIYFAQNPEFVNVASVVDPSVMDLSEIELVALQAEMEFGIDDVEEILYREAGFQYRIQEYIESGGATIDPVEFAAEYELLKKSLVTFELIDFIGIRFPNARGAQEEAQKARERIDAGERFDDVLQSYMAINGEFGMRSAFENNPSQPRFRRFWYSVTGCATGDILGPVFLSSYEQVELDAAGNEVTQRQPDSWVVLEVLEHRAPRLKTIDESREQLMMPILARKVMENMREEFGVVVYPEGLWRPEGYGGQFEDSMIRTK
jgi:hypothetical protein